MRGVFWLSCNLWLLRTKLYNVSHQTSETIKYTRNVWQRNIWNKQTKCSQHHCNLRHSKNIKVSKKLVNVCKKFDNQGKILLNSENSYHWVSSKQLKLQCNGISETIRYRKSIKLQKSCPIMRTLQSHKHICRETRASLNINRNLKTSISFFHPYL